MKELYACDFKYGKPVLAKVTISKETEKTVTIAEYHRILGWSYFGKRTPKDEWQWCINLADAIDWLVVQSTEYAKKLQAEADIAVEQVKQLQEISTHPDRIVYILNKDLYNG